MTSSDTPPLVPQVLGSSASDAFELCVRIDAGAEFQAMMRRVWQAVATTLTPLSAATKGLLEPLDISPDEYLIVDIGKEPRYLKLSFETLTSDVRHAQRHVTHPRVMPDGRKLWLEDPTPSESALTFIKRLPEVVKGTSIFSHQVGATDFTALLIATLWPAKQVIFQCEEAKNIIVMMILRFVAQSKRAEQVARFKLNGELPKLPPDWVEHTEYPLSDYQKLGVLFALEQGSSGFFMDRGVGKTATTVQLICLEALRYKRANKGMYRALIICPLQVRTNWQAEFQKFGVARGKVTVLKGDRAGRVRLLTLAIRTEPGCVFSVVVVGYATAAETPNLLKSIKWDRIVCDESQHFKSSQTQRWRQLIQPIREATNRRLVLTGSPIGNSIMDLWSQLEFLGEGLSGFVTFKGYKTMHGQWETSWSDGIGVERLITVKNVPMMHERLTRITYSISKEEAGLKLPPKVYDIIEVEMTPKQAKFYQQLAEELAIEIEARLETEQNSQLTASNILTSLLRLAQITSGFISWDPIVNDETLEIIAPRRIEQISTPNPKIEALLELLQAEDRDPKAKAIVWAIFVPDLKAIAAALAEAGIEAVMYYGQVSMADREVAVRRFNCDPACRVMIANPQAAGEGLNLLGFDTNNQDTSDTYTDLEVFFSQNWSAILREQAEDRAHRRGTKMPVRITDLMVPGTIDEEIRNRVQGKRAAAIEITDVREILKTLQSFKEE